MSRRGERERSPDWRARAALPAHCTGAYIMMQEQKVIRAKVGVLELAKQLGNVSQACKMMGYSRDSFYRFKELYDKGGELALEAKMAQEGFVLTESQVVALEKAKTEKEVHGEFESECPGYCGAQDTFYVGNMKGVGRIYQQTFIDTYAKVVFAKLYDRKTPITAAEILNDRVLPFFEEHGIALCRVLTDRGTEYCGNPEHHDYELYLAVEDIDHTRTKTKSPQTNGICERFHRTVLDEFYRVAFRKKIYRTIDELQRDLDAWVKEYNETRPHQGRWCYGKTPLQTFLDALPIAREKLLPAA
jgi:transposase InsO family protein